MNETLAKYGLQDMQGDPAAILDRHLTNGHAAAIGFWQLSVEILTAKLNAAETALREMQDNCGCCGHPKAVHSRLYGCRHVENGAESCDCPIGDKP